MLLGLFFSIATIAQCAQEVCRMYHDCLSYSSRRAKKHRRVILLRNALRAEPLPIPILKCFVDCRCPWKMFADRWARIL